MKYNFRGRSWRAVIRSNRAFIAWAKAALEPARDTPLKEDQG